MAAEAVSQIIFFIAVAVVSTAAAGVMTNIIIDVADDLGVRADDLADRIRSDVEIINDPQNVPNDPVIFYVLNTGDLTISHELVTVVLNGVAIPSTSLTISLLGSDTTFRPGAVVSTSYATNLGTGVDHSVRVVFETGVFDELDFRVI